MNTLKQFICRFIDFLCQLQCPVTKIIFLSENYHSVPAKYTRRQNHIYANIPQIKNYHSTNYGFKITPFLVLYNFCVNCNVM